MRVEYWLIIKKSIRHPGYSKREVIKEPKSLDAGEVAIHVKMDIAESLFEPVKLKTTINVEDSGRTLSTVVANAIKEHVEDRFDVDVSVK